MIDCLETRKQIAAGHDAVMYFQPTKIKDKHISTNKYFKLLKLAFFH